MRQIYRSSNIIRVEQKPLDRLSLPGFGQSLPALLCRELLPDVVFGETERRNSSSGAIFRFLLQLLRRMGEQTEEEGSAYCHQVAHFTSQAHGHDDRNKAVLLRGIDDAELERRFSVLEL